MRFFQLPAPAITFIHPNLREVLNRGPDEIRGQHSRLQVFAYGFNGEAAQKAVL